jgi:hypothetical protein
LDACGQPRVGRRTAQPLEDHQGDNILFKKSGTILAVTAFSLTLAACASMGGGGGASHGDSGATPAPAAKVGPGMNANGEVIDASKVESGYGQKVKGINDYDGEITGIPAPNSKFTQLKIGMGFRQVQDIAGPPTDQGAYITGKAFIPFYFGSDRTRSEFVYKGEGRLIFAGGSFGDLSGGNLIWIIHCASEPGYR